MARGRARALPLLLAAVAVAAAPAMPAPTFLQQPEDRVVPAARACEAFVDADTAPSYCDPSLPIDDRVEDLLGRMTADEKISLLVNAASAVPSQKLPAYEWWNEALHGVGGAPGVTFAPPTPTATSFPQVVTTSHSFNPALVHAIGSAVGSEGRVFNNYGHAGNTFWTPNVNIYRDPRWGRGHETPGEDPFLSSVYATNFVRGLQEGEDPRYLKGSACCKHFAAYSLENLYNGSQRHNFDAHVTAQDMADTYLPAFEACVRKGRASALMCSYNSINGVPACANEDLLNGKARGEWGFDGYITSDCGAIADIWSHHNYTATPEEACRVALRAGCDLDCSDFYRQHCPTALAQGQITEEDLDAALRHLFRVQFRLGLFDPADDQVYTKYDLNLLNSADHQALALKAARQGIVLLKNERGALPLSLYDAREDLDEEAQQEGEPRPDFQESAMVASIQKTTLLRHQQQRPAGYRPSRHPPRRHATPSVAMIGPHANATQALLGNYFGVPPFIVSPIEGFRRYVPDAVLAPGCGINETLPAQLAEAEAAARAADVVVLVLGLDLSIENEGKDRTSIALPTPQLQLAERVLAAAAASTPVILVLIAGGSVDLSMFVEDERVPAIVFAGYPGQSGGQALAEVLVGDVNPSGRLTQTFYPAAFVEQAGAGDMRMRPDASSGFPGRTYRFYQGEVVYPFGHGLSYSRFLFQAVTCPSDPNMILGGKIVHLTTASLEEPESEVVGRACVEVTNLGPVAGRVVLLGFLSPPHSGGVEGAPAKSLRAFGGLKLSPHESVLAVMTFTEVDVSLADGEGVFQRVGGDWLVSLEDVRVILPVGE